MIIRLEEIRKRKNISMTELARICDIDKSTISRIESGSSVPSVYLLLRLTLALGVTLNEMIDIDAFRREILDEHK